MPPRKKSERDAQEASKEPDGGFPISVFQGRWLTTYDMMVTVDMKAIYLNGVKHQRQLTQAPISKKWKWNMWELVDVDSDGRLTWDYDSGRGMTGATKVGWIPLGNLKAPLVVDGMLLKSWKRRSETVKRYHSGKGYWDLEDTKVVEEAYQFSTSSDVETEISDASDKGEEMKRMTSARSSKAERSSSDNKPSDPGKGLVKADQKESNANGLARPKKSSGRQRSRRPLTDDTSSAHSTDAQDDESEEDGFASGEEDDDSAQAKRTTSPKRRRLESRPKRRNLRSTGPAGAASTGSGDQGPCMYHRASVLTHDGENENAKEYVQESATLRNVLNASQFPVGVLQQLQCQSYRRLLKQANYYLTRTFETEDLLDNGQELCVLRYAHSDTVLGVCTMMVKKTRRDIKKTILFFTIRPNMRGGGLSSKFVELLLKYDYRDRRRDVYKTLASLPLLPQLDPQKAQTDVKAVPKPVPKAGAGAPESPPLYCDKKGRPIRLFTVVRVAQNGEQETLSTFWRNQGFTIENPPDSPETPFRNCIVLEYDSSRIKKKV